METNQGIEESEKGGPKLLHLEVAQHLGRNAQTHTESVGIILQLNRHINNNSDSRELVVDAKIGFLNILPSDQGE